MFEKLNKTYGIQLNLSPEKKMNGIPIYMTAGRKIYEAEYEGLVFLLVCIPDANRIGSVALEKQLTIYQQAAEMPVAYAFEKLTPVQRSALIKRRIPYIAEPDQLFLPFTGVMLRNSLSNKIPAQAEKMMPATQMLFLHLVYKGKNGCLKKDAADDLGLTRTSITRASEQLTAMGLIQQEKKGKEIKMFPTATGREAFELARPYLIDPVQRSFYAECSPELKGSVLSGESALAAATMLSEPRFPIYALDKRSEALRELHETDPKWSAGDDICMVEVWKYDPALFCTKHCADPISLAMVLGQIEDERVEGALEEYLENAEW